MEVAVAILSLGLSLLRGDSADTAKTLSEIVRIAATAYREHVGKPIDPSLIKAL